jgi:8-oxo-dGTP pyrophosphatase MutT (NUDIX family)
MLVEFSRGNSYINKPKEYLKNKKVNYKMVATKSWAFKPMEKKNLTGEKYIETFSDICYNVDSDCEVQKLEDKVLNKRSGIIIKTRSSNIMDVQFLVVRGVNGHIWSLPKGRMKENESEEECAIRELFEETGIKLHSMEGLRKCKISKNVYFILEVDDPMEYCDFEIYDTLEVDKVEWKSFKELKELQCNKDIRAIMGYPEKCHTYHTIVFEDLEKRKL